MSPVPRLTELLARNLGVSKTAVARLIEAGRVCDTNGSIFADRRTLLDGDQGDGATPEDVPPVVIVDGKTVSLWSRALILLHKPVGVVSAHPEPGQVPAVRLLTREALVGESPVIPDRDTRLAPVGRLDMDSRGLLILSEDGVLAKANWDIALRSATTTPIGPIPGPPPP